MRSLALACLLAVSAAAWAQGVNPPFASAGDVQGLSADERRVWAEAGDYDRALQRRGELFGNDEVDAYLQGLLERLFPEFRGVLRVRLLNNPQLNAFALPNGSLYINLGLLARMENESQLATVLAHEACHFLFRHGYQQRQNLKSSSAFALGLGVIAGNVGALVGNLAALASVYGYSRDLEREADRMGAERAVRGGYDLREGGKVFAILDAEAKVLETKEPFMFASHPRLQERIESFEALGRDRTPGTAREQDARFDRLAPALRTAWMESELALARHKSLIHVLGAREATDTLYPAAGYYLGEAFLLRGEEGDDVRAEQAFRATVKANPDYAPTYRALGLLLMKRDARREARQMLAHYLERSPAAPDGDYMRQYLQQLDAPH